MEILHHKIIIVGGGTGGIAVAARLARGGETDIAIIEPSKRHFYQPLWTLVGAGVVQKEASVRDQGQLIPDGVRWIKDSVRELVPEGNYLLTGAAKIGYDFLVLAPGIQFNWEAIRGLKEAVRRDNVSTNYVFDLAPKTWTMIENFKGGTALFHMPGAPVKCPGAPQKIMYLAADRFRRKGLRGANVIYGSGTASIYGIADYATVLNKVVERYGIDTRFNHELVEVRPERNEAVFVLRNQPDSPRTTIPYDILHVVPPQGAPDFVRQSSLADPQKPIEGWVKLDKFTMRSPGFPNVFALGDVANTPNAKTGASAYKQAPVVARNLMRAIAGKEPDARYEGYVACPIVTGYGRMLLCEFDYSLKPAPTIPFINTFKERYDMWLLKRYGLPWLYWNVIVKGRSMPFANAPEPAAASPQAALDHRA